MVVDTSVLLAALDAKDPRHPAAIAVLDGHATGAPILPAPILGEVDYWLRKRGLGGAWTALCEDIAASVYVLHDLTPSALLDVARLQAKYADLRIGFVDAAVFLTCVVLDDDTVASFDRRHFSVLRTEDGRALEIVP